ncbi:MAG: c-type cytochrome [Aquificae bacterium]|nr:c-type cytochrome [Aquificota bacterium]
MKNLVKTALLGVVSTSLIINASKADIKTFFKYEVLPSKQISQSVPSDPRDELWSMVPGKYVFFYPQISVRLNDADANRVIPKKRLQKALVKVVYNSENIAVYIRWKDRTPSIQPVYTTKAFGDGISVEFPNDFGAGKTLPYVGMGDLKHPVTVYLQKTVAGKDYEKTFISEGFGTLTEITENGVSMEMDYDKAKREWIAVIKRPLKTKNSDLRAGLVPIAFAIWNGSQQERDGNKSLSRWKFIRLKSYKIDKEYLAYISWGDMIHKEADPNRGKKLTIQNGCNACHIYDDQRTAPLDMAPDLSNIGGIAHAPYLKESLVDPNDVIIRNLNPNRHYNKFAQPDKNGAYPNNDMYTWYIKTPDGKIQSKMPSFSHLSEQDIKDIIAYLKTLRNWRNFK